MEDPSQIDQGSQQSLVCVNKFSYSHLVKSEQLL